MSQAARAKDVIRKHHATSAASDATSRRAQGRVERDRNGRTSANEDHVLITIKDAKLVAVKELHLCKRIQP